MQSWRKKILKKYGVEVLRPENINSTNQIFARDIAFAINDKFILPNIINERKSEQHGISKIISQIDSENIIRLDNEIFIEGGDIVLNNNDIFIGYSNNSDFNKYKVARTNIKAVKFIEEKTETDDVEVKGAELKDGLLKVSMEKIIPESKKLKTITIK